jgi:predicted acetyltransferase
MTELELQSVEASDGALQVVLQNLLELYIHDLSESFAFVELGPDGRFGYPGLAAYWSEPGRRYAFLIREAGKTAGFALVTLGSPAVEERDVYDLAEFFVLRSHRRGGLGRRAAFRLWRLLPGKWTVRGSESNPAALAFWTRVVGEFTNGEATLSTWSGRASQFRVFGFNSSRLRSQGEAPTAESR